MKKLLQNIKDWLFIIKLNRLITKAEKKRKIERRHYLIINYNGKLKVVARKDLKRLLADKRFKKGLTIQDLENK